MVVDHRDGVLHGCRKLTVDPSGVRPEVLGRSARSAPAPLGRSAPRRGRSAPRRAAGVRPRDDSQSSKAPARVGSHPPGNRHSSLDEGRRTRAKKPSPSIATASPRAASPPATRTSHAGSVPSSTSLRTRTHVGGCRRTRSPQPGRSVPPGSSNILSARSELTSSGVNWDALRDGNARAGTCVADSATSMTTTASLACDSSPSNVSERNAAAEIPWAPK